MKIDHRVVSDISNVIDLLTQWRQWHQNNTMYMFPSKDLPEIVDILEQAAEEHASWESNHQFGEEAV